tara:strand:+ start:864 stop:1295 length:432 start_codon:yes stop_codon:yes gene_type:complete
MPNWIKNSVSVCVPKGVDKERLRIFSELVGDDFSFERISPMPEIFIPKWYENLTQEEIEKEKIPWNYVPPWYSWRLENWGCKWDASDVTFMYDHNDEVMLSCFFSTPWSPPEPICSKLKLDFPDLLIQWIWYDTDDFQGCFTL